MSELQIGTLSDLLSFTLVVSVCSPCSFHSLLPTSCLGRSLMVLKLAGTDSKLRHARGSFHGDAEGKALSMV